MPPPSPSLISRLKEYYTPKQSVPALSTTTAVGLLILYTLVYVVPFYLSPTTRPSPTLHRDAPSVIRGRIRSVSISSFICCLVTFLLVLFQGDGGTVWKALHLMGLYPLGIIEAGKSLALISILFIGPLFKGAFAEGQWKNWLRLRGVSVVLEDWTAWRNLVAAPITEEILFRSASVPLLLIAHTSNTTTIFLTPIVFGLAHFHHFYERRVMHPDMPIMDTFLMSLAQLGYTTLFGGFVTFLYVRTGSLLAVILVHMFCNWQGFPQIWGRLEGVEIVHEFNKKSEDGLGNPKQLGVSWTIVYYALLVAGLHFWWSNLWTLTESASALSKF